MEVMATVSSANKIRPDKEKSSHGPIEPGIHPEEILGTTAVELTSQSKNPSSSIMKTPLLHPSEDSTAPTPPTLTPAQSTKYDSLLSTVASWTTIPTASTTNSPTTPITDAEQMWLTRECLLRYLRASKWALPEATKRLLATLVWRREYILPEHTAEYFSEENSTGKQVIFGWDVATRPCLYLNPGKQNTPRSEKQVQHLVFMLERTIDLMGPGQETLALLINYKEAMNGPKTGQARQVLNILQSHYPERLGKALVINGSVIPEFLPEKHLINMANPRDILVHWLVGTFFKLINPFIDPVTREKLKFDQNLREFVPPSHLMKAYGGDADFIYDHDLYWPAMVALTARRREEQTERWILGGKKVGELEAYLKGGIEKGLGGGGDTRVENQSVEARELSGENGKAV